jgi:ABC-type glycerol-3-phosphate transport system substrate-binding protein
MSKKWCRAVTLAAVICLIAAGCSGGEGKTGEGNTDGQEMKLGQQTGQTQNQKQENKEPVTLHYFQNLMFTDEEFKLLVEDPVKKKYPYISFERSQGDLAKILVGGQVPDIIQSHSGLLSTYQSLGAASDLGELVKRNNLDLNRFEPAILNSLKDDKGRLLALPYGINMTALFYNKDIFDKQGVPYPKDGMTWEQVIELSKKVTFSEGGVKYRGLDPETLVRFSRVMAIDYVDGKTMKSTFNDPRWKTAFETLKRIYTLPGNEPAKLGGNTGKDPFLKDKTVAMFATTNQIHAMVDASKEGLHWDVVQYPSFPGRENISTDVDAFVFEIPETAKNKEAALKVIEVFTSDEVQKLLVSKTARISPLKDPMFKQAFASDIEGIQGKNISGIFKGKVVEAPVRTRYLQDAQKIAESVFIEYAQDKMDTNTALRRADEEINKFVATQK